MEGTLRLVHFGGDGLSAVEDLVEEWKWEVL